MTSEKYSEAHFGLTSITTDGGITYRVSADNGETTLPPLNEMSAEEYEDLKNSVEVWLEHDMDDEELRDFRSILDV